MFYVQLLSVEIPKARKTVKLSVCFVLSGSGHKKAAGRTLLKLTIGVKFHQHFMFEFFVQKFLCSFLSNYSLALNFFLAST